MKVLSKLETVRREYFIKKKEKKKKKISPVNKQLQLFAYI